MNIDNDTKNAINNAIIQTLSQLNIKSNPQNEVELSTISIDDFKQADLQDGTKTKPKTKPLITNIPTDISGTLIREL
jgi:hypothetical protein